MPTNNFEVACVHEVCPICGKPMNEQIIINRELTKKSAEEVRKLHNKAIGFSDNACEDCTKHKDKCTFCISIDIKRSEPNNPYRTGQIVGVKKGLYYVCRTS